MGLRSNGGLNIYYMCVCVYACMFMYVFIYTLVHFFRAKLTRYVHVLRINATALEYTSYGKPSPSVFRNAENVLMEVARSSSTMKNPISAHNPFKTLYMIGDNPAVDINGARQVQCIQISNLFLLIH